MTAKDLLGVIVRAFGLGIIALGFYTILYGLLELADLLMKPAQFPAHVHFVWGIVYFLLGYIIIRCTNRIVDFSFISFPARDKK